MLKVTFSPVIFGDNWMIEIGTRGKSVSVPDNFDAHVSFRFNSKDVIMLSNLIIIIL